MSKAKSIRCYIEHGEQVTKSDSPAVNPAIAG